MQCLQINTLHLLQTFCTPDIAHEEEMDVEIFFLYTTASKVTINTLFVIFGYRKEYWKTKCNIF